MQNVTPNNPTGAMLLNALASNEPPSMAALQALWKAGQTWLAAEGTVPLERFARLPTTPAGLRTATRNLWIGRAAALLPGATRCHAKADLLAEQLLVFITRGPWQCWRSAGAPPEDASDLRHALFHIAKYNDGAPLSSRQISRIIATY